ncbi:MAG: MFS transporter [Planctomycetota bacterium]
MTDQTQTDNPPDNERLTGVQIKALGAAFLGWAFDGLDGYLYVMVAGQFVGQLLGKGPKDPETTSKATIIMSVFLVGWAVGGAVFGRIGDRLGRAKTLTLTVLTYAVFTGVCFFAQTWWHLLIFRFVAALGIGGEWAAGSALVSETLPKRHKVWGSAVLQSGYMVGCILASITTGVMSSYQLEPKWVFVVGVLPAFLTVFIRRAVPEPESWKAAAKHEAMPPVTALFAPGIRRTTLLLSAFTSVSMLISWSYLFFVPFIVQRLPETLSWTAEQKSALVSRVSIVYFLVCIAANFVATGLSRRYGYRASFFIMLSLGMFFFLYGFSRELNTTNIYWVTSGAMFFGLGYFGNFPLYIPPLFPTLVRTLGSGFTYNVGRLVSAVGVFFLGDIVNKYGPTQAVWATGFMFIPGLILTFFLPEPKER